MKADNNDGIPFTLGLFWEMLKASEGTSGITHIWLFLNKKRLGKKKDPAELNPLLHLCCKRRGFSESFFFLLGVFLTSAILFTFTIPMNKGGDGGNVGLASGVVALVSFFLLLLSIWDYNEQHKVIEEVEGRIKEYYKHFADNIIRWDDIRPAVRIYYTLAKAEIETEESKRHKNKGLFDLATQLLCGESIDTVYKDVHGRIIKPFMVSNVPASERDITLLRLTEEFLGYSSPVAQ